MPSFAEFREITQADEPLAPHTWLRIGGPAQYFVRPRTADEAIGVVRACANEGIEIRVLGGGSNLLVRDEGVSGCVLRFDHPGFSEVKVDGQRVTAGAGALLSNVVSLSVKTGLAGLDTLVGIPGTIGGALHGNAGGRSGDIGQYVHSVQVLLSNGEVVTRSREELAFAYRQSSLTDVTVLSATFDLHPEDADEITRRMRKLWIMKKATQPLTFQSAGCIFRNPRGLRAGLMIEQAGLKGTRIGNVEVSDRHANFLVSHDKASSADALRLIDLVRSKVAEQFGVDLESEIVIW
jgi:UDP-N-acetylmuramate dehydrogenase